jgi:hypothetical protein
MLKTSSRPPPPPHTLLGRSAYALQGAYALVILFLSVHADLTSMLPSFPHPAPRALPNSLPQIQLYLGLALVRGLAGPADPLLPLLLWVGANLAYAAQETLRWYRDKFEDFPRDVRAIVPLWF